MIIKDDVWEHIRMGFTIEEKDLLRQALRSRIICPAASEIDTSELPEDLQEKLYTYLEEYKKVLK